MNLRETRIFGPRLASEMAASAVLDKPSSAHGAGDRNRSGLSATVGVPALTAPTASWGVGGGQVVLLLASGV